MKTYFIDSDVLIDFFKKKPEAAKLIEELGSLGKTAISVISVAELRAGWSNKDAAIYLPRLYNIFEVISITQDIAEKAGEIREQHSKKGSKLPTIDALIGATAIIYKYCLVTRNIKHFPMSEIDLYQDIYNRNAENPAFLKRG